MLEKAKKLISLLENNGFESYIIGGFVRDFYLGRDSLDADITTSATPKQIRAIFQNDYSDSEEYGTSIVFFAGSNFQVTTFRSEKNYEDYRRPKKIKYIKSFTDDLKRRDFTINTMAIDMNGELIDYLGAKKDLDDKIIKTVGNPYVRLKEDPLRILRAIRFATLLGFKLDEELKQAIISNRELLKKISYSRKKEELEKIFTSFNMKIGLKLIKDLNLEASLDISFTKVIPNPDILAIWSQIEMSDKYPFKKTEKEVIEAVKQLRKKDLFDPIVLYNYDLYALSLSAETRGIDRSLIADKHKKLVIHSRKDIVLDSVSICEILHRSPGEFLKEIYRDLEQKILLKEIRNTKKELTMYLKTII